MPEFGKINHSQTVKYINSIPEVMETSSHLKRLDTYRLERYNIR